MAFALSDQSALRATCIDSSILRAIRENPNLCKVWSHSLLDAQMVLLFLPCSDLNVPMELIILNN